MKHYPFVEFVSLYCEHIEYIRQLNVESTRPILNQHLPLMLKRKKRVASKKNEMTNECVNIQLSCHPLNLVYSISSQSVICKVIWQGEKVTLTSIEKREMKIHASLRPSLKHHFGAYWQAQTHQFTIFSWFYLQNTCQCVLLNVKWWGDKWQFDVR